MTNIAATQRLGPALALIGLAMAGLTACDLTGPDPLTAAVAVAVRIDDAPMADVAVSLFSPGDSVPVQQATTGADGTALLSDLVPDSYEVAVVVPSAIPLAGGQPDRVPVFVFGGQTVTLTFRLEREPVASAVMARDR